MTWLHLLLLINLGLTGLSMVGWLVYEGIAVTNHVDGDTISELIWAFVRAKPFMATVLCIVLGILLGHLFWQENRAAIKVAVTKFLQGGAP